MIGDCCTVQQQAVVMMIFCFIMSNKYYEGEPHVFGASYLSFHFDFPHLRTSSVNMASIAFIFSSCHCMYESIYC